MIYLNVTNATHLPFYLFILLRHERSKRVAWICMIILFKIILYNFNTDYSNSQTMIRAAILESIKQRRSSRFKVVTFQMYE